MKTLHAALLGLLMVCSLSAQNREAQPLAATALGMTTANDSVMAFDQKPFLFGWNWNSMDASASRALRTNMHHTGDPFQWGTSGNAVDIFNMTRTSGMLLSPTVHSISTEHVPGINGGLPPAMSIGIEWQPWLDVQADTFVLRPNDSTGGVFGFKSRHATTTPTIGFDSVWRLRLNSTDFTAPTEVLSAASPDDGLRFALTGFGSRDHYYFTTKRLFVAVNIRVYRDDTLTGNAGDTVLKVTLPYWKWRKCKPAQDSTKSFIRFRRIPVASAGASTITSTLGETMGTRWDTEETNLAPDAIYITRGMLPAFGPTNPGITVYAAFECDRDATHTNAWNNPEFNTYTVSARASTYSKG